MSDFLALDMLQANGIAPRPPKAPTALVEPTDVIDLTLSDDEDREEDKDDVRDAEITALKVSFAFVLRPNGSAEAVFLRQG